ncbi:hypothetical protein AB0N77_33325 [Streptomyces misionensis]|uniref:hypothetical protein n=1 Tax=Streptomyces misionensis TaxID=67331 RepID=UPI0034404C67
MSPQPTTMLDGDTVYRIVWVPGTDRLRGWCWCGEPRESEDPVELWEWLLAHPDGHPGPGAAPAPDPAPRPHRLVGA